MEIPQIGVNNINISPPNINNWLVKPIDLPPVVDQLPKPIINIPGCVKAHRNNKPSLIEDDARGVVYKCDLELPNYKPLEYTPNTFIYTSSDPPPKKKQKSLEPPITERKFQEKEKEEEVFKPCPGPNDQRRGDYRNSQKLERVSSHIIDSKGDCITLYEEVLYIERWLPSPALAVNTATIALIAASTPLLLSVIKPAVKNLFKKITKKKKEEEKS